MADLCELHQKLHAAVKSRLDLVADHAYRDRDPAAHLAALKSAAAMLDAEMTDLSAEIDPTLRHYLERQSYIKALAWLDEAVAKSSH
jgi:hypothetical protein